MYLNYVASVRQLFGIVRGIRHELVFVVVELGFIKQTNRSLIMHIYSVDKTLDILVVQFLSYY